MSLLTIAQEKFTPTNWQLEDLEYLSKRDYSANWSEMGCYKTTTGLWLQQRKTQGVENPHSLIITTKAGKGTYYDAIPKTMPDYRVYNIHTKGITQLLFGNIEEQVDIDEYINFIMNPIKPAITLAHYHCFTNRAAIKELLLRIEWDHIIIDEAHRIKNKDAQWTRNIKHLKSIEGRKHIMTGTGFINDPSEIWSLLNFLDRKRFSSYWKFRREFCLEENWTGFAKVVGIKPEKKDEFIALRKEIGVRRMMNEVHQDVKEPIFTEYLVDLNATQRKMYNDIRDILSALDQKGEPIYAPNVLAQLNRLRQVCVATPNKIGEYYDPKLDRMVQEIELIEPSSKLDTVMEILEGLEWDEENKQQVVIFSTFKDPLKLLRDRFEKAGIPYLHMTERMNEMERYKLWHDLFPQKQHRVFMSTLQLGSESINLTPAQYAIFLDRSWSPKDNSQGIGRLYRPGQTRVPNIININARNTVDQRIERAVNTKMGWFKAIFNDDD